MAGFPGAATTAPLRFGIRCVGIDYTILQAVRVHELADGASVRRAVRNDGSDDLLLVYNEADVLGRMLRLVLRFGAEEVALGRAKG